MKQSETEEVSLSYKKEDGTVIVEQSSRWPNNHVNVSSSDSSLAAQTKEERQSRLQRKNASDQSEQFVNERTK